MSHSANQVPACDAKSVRKQRDGDPRYLAGMTYSFANLSKSRLGNSCKN